MKTSTNTITGTGLFNVLIVLWSVWYLGAAFFAPPVWFHIIGVAAFMLTIFRIARGDD
ncbi:MAG: hypothetical protein NVV59_12425 [Chitinophagaceae bacterium]|nr:hypothetical protein [Chitinophagaceae bacterium]